MVNVGLLLRLEAKPGKEADVAAFLTSALPQIQEEQGTAAWFGIQLGPSTFGIFDAFPDEEGRKAHMTGQVAAVWVGSISKTTGTLVGMCEYLHQTSMP